MPDDAPIPNHDPDCRRRRLAAVLFSDVKGYSRAMKRDEDATLDLLADHDRLIEEQLQRHRGRKIKTMGDAYMVEFPSVVDAVACALDAQRSFARHNDRADPQRRIHVRIGVHLAEAVDRGDGDLFGHDVDVAARLEGQAPPGAVCVSEEVLVRVRGKVDATAQSLGPRPLKNVGTMELYVLWPAEERLPGPDADQPLTTGPTMVPSRTALVRKVIADLTTDAPGVALLAPLGFGARQVVADVVGRLREPDGRRLVVRLVPDPRTNDEARLYGALIRDLLRGLERELGKPLPPDWSALFPDPQRPASEESFERTLEMLLGGPAARDGRTLVLVVERLSRIEPGKLVGWAWLINRLAGELPLKLLARGRSSLHDLCTGCTGLAETSPFQSLKRHEVRPWTRDEVRTLVTDAGADRTRADALYRVVGGHPALVRELLERAHPEICRGDEDGLRSRALSSDHLRRLHAELERAPVAARELQRIADGDREQRYQPAEQRLRWLGIVEEDGPSAWRWTAPVLKNWSVEIGRGDQKP